MATRRDPSNAGELTKLLSDPNEVIRYWAAQGLLMLKSRAAEAVSALQARLDNDPSPGVCVVVAEALAGLIDPENPVRYLSGVLASDANPRVRLQALNALTWIGSAAKAALPSIDDAAADARADEYIRAAARYLSMVLNGTYTPAAPIYQGPGARGG
jgi:HEAT repeat protein